MVTVGRRWYLSGVGVVLFGLVGLSSSAQASVFCTSTPTNIPLGECEALYDLYTASNGTNWNNDTGWFEDADVENRHGITLLSSGGQNYVQMINLNANNLAGNLPVSIDDFSFLQHLSLGNNAILSLPNEIGNITSLLSLDVNNNNILSLPNVRSNMDALTQLNLSHNGLTTLPASITEMSSLSTLYVNNNALTSLPTLIGDLASLTLLDAKYNLLTSIPDSFGSLANLQTVYFNNNQLTSLPDTLGGLTSLVDLYVGNNLLASLPDSIGQLSNLSFLELKSNLLTSLPSTIGGLSSLDTLYLESNLLMTLPSEIGTLYDLDTLYVHANRLSTLPNSLGDLTSLQRLVIHTNQLTSLPAAWGGLTNLTWLHAHTNTGMIGAVPTTYTGLVSLQQFYIFGNALNRTNTGYAVIDPLLSSWLNGVTTKHYHGQLDISSPIITTGSTVLPALLTGAFSYELGINENSYAINTQGSGMMISFTGGINCSALTTNSSFTQNTGVVAITITPTVTGGYENCAIYTTDHAGLVSNILQIGSFAFGDSSDDRCDHPSVTVPSNECRALFAFYSSTSGASWTTKTNRLTNFDIESRYGVRTNEYNGEEHIDGLFLHRSNLTSDAHGAPIFWNGNNVRGALPIELADLPYLKDLNLSRNSTLSGSLPDVSGWSQLQYFYIEQADIQGTIGPSWSGQTSLQVLSLPGNNLTGTLPTGMQWNSLHTLDLNSNQFIGELPGSWSAFTTLLTLSLYNNKFTGTIPESWFALNSLDTFYLQGNNLNRLVNRQAVIPTSLQSRWNAISTKNASSQGDITPPVVSGTGTIPWLVTGAFLYQVTISENSYAINEFDEGMRVTISGGSLCSSLSSSDISLNQGQATLTLTPALQGEYADCVLTVKDHANNISNEVILPTFAYDTTNTQVCYNPALSITTDDCLALVVLYNTTNGSNWTQDTNWTTATDVTTWYGITVKEQGVRDRVAGIALPNNNLAGELPSSLTILDDLELLHLSENALTNIGSIDWSQLENIESINLSANLYTGTLPSSIGTLASLEYLNLSDNEFYGALPSSRSTLTLLETFDLSNNQFTGTLPSWLGSLLSLQSLSLQDNDFVGTLPSSLLGLNNLALLDLQNNALNRENTHIASIPPSLSGWITSVTTYNGDGQRDTTPPLVTETQAIPAIVSGAFSYSFGIDENSYAVTLGGTGMAVTFSGLGSCQDIISLQDVTISSGQATITIVPLVEDSYTNCSLYVEDHGGNFGWILIDSFSYDLSCGDGVIDEGEDCDEGRSCPDGNDCTENPGLCPGLCEPRFVDGCTPLCQMSRCGDLFLDSDGVDNVPGTSDDEYCDEGSICLSNSLSCTLNAHSCPGGAEECVPVPINGCTTQCTFATCGDGLLGEGEGCDDGNITNGDGCSSSCQIEYCGDNRVDPNGINNIIDDADDEQCDEGANNGLLAGLCSISCELPGAGCSSCREQCSGGTGKHSVFLLIDVSGSMNGYERFVNAKAAHHRYMDLLHGGELNGSGEVISGSVAGIIAFNNHASVIIEPTNDYEAVHFEIDDLTAGGSTNYADALAQANAYFSSLTAPGVDYHIIVLGDGEATHPGGSKKAEPAAIVQADLLKAMGVEIYTVGLQTSEDTTNFLSEISSGTGYAYVDPTNTNLINIYEEIYGSIHCNCFNAHFCPICGDDIVSEGEECDEGSYCDDMTECTSDPSICPSECRPRFVGQCTNMCERTHCGDGVIQAPNYTGQVETCDDGNTTLGDGCSPTCTIEFCGDGVRDINGPDNIWLNEDDEQCDLGAENGTPGGDCTIDCQWVLPEDPIDGACTVYGGIYNFAGDGQPNEPFPGALCDTGVAVDLTYTGNQWIWYCAGLNGGANVQCIEQEYRCGDGVTETGNGEECDDGDLQSGDGCSATCQLEPPVSVPVAQGERCQSGDPVVIQSDEILPLRWQLLPVENIDLEASSCGSLAVDKWIPADSITCTLGVYNAENGTVYRVHALSGVDCVRAGAMSETTTAFWGDLFSDHDVIPESILGTTIVDDLATWSEGRKGRYRTNLESVSYTFCGRDRDGQIDELPVTYTPTADEPICTIPFTVTDGYLLQKGVSLASLANTQLHNLYMSESGYALEDEGFLSNQGNAAATTYQHDYVQQIIHTLVDTHRFGAVVPSSMLGTTESVQKVINKPIYYFRGTTLNPDIVVSNRTLADDVPFTLLVENADLIVDGSLFSKGLFLVKNGSIIFRNNSCDAIDTVQGIFATDQGFTTTRIRNDDSEAEQWCHGGGLRVDGILIGLGVDETFIANRRATLDLWSTRNNTDLFINYTDQQLPPSQLNTKVLEKHTRLFEGASVLVTTQPQQWHKLSPGARELFDQLLLFIGQ